jgi:hypothetical protein
MVLSNQAAALWRLAATQAPLGRAVVDSAIEVRLMKIFLGILGGFTLLVSLFMISAAIGDLVSGDEAPGIMIGLMAFFGGTGYGGYRLMRHGFGKAGALPAIDVGEREQRVLALASRSHGRLTVAEVALLPGFDVDSARETLDRLCHKEVARHMVSDAGAMVYAFDGLLPGDKETAQDPLA